MTAVAQPSNTRSSAGLWVAAFIVVAILAGSLGVLVATRNSQSHVRVWSSRQVFRHSRVVVSNRRPGRPIRTLVVQSDGGPARIDWSDGYVSAVRSRSGMYVGLYIDGRLAASSLFGELSGRFEGGPEGVRWVGHLRPGRHVVQVRVDRTDPGFAVPRASVAHPVMDLLRVTEYE
jgi:hypothetical protein